MGGSIKKEEFFWLIKGFPGCIVDNVEQDRLYTHTDGVFVQRSPLRKHSTLQENASGTVIDPLRPDKTSCFVIRTLIPFK